MKWILLVLFIGLIASRYAVKWALKHTPDDDLWRQSVLRSLIDMDGLLFVALFIIAIFD